MSLKEYRQSRPYRWWKDQMLLKDKLVCQDCGAFGGPLDAHHKVAFAEDVNARFDPENGIALCPLCHGKRHGKPEGFIRTERPEGTSKKGRSITITQELYEFLEEIMEVEHHLSPRDALHMILHRYYDHAIREWHYVNENGRYVERYLSKWEFKRLYGGIGLIGIRPTIYNPNLR